MINERDANCIDDATMVVLKNKHALCEDLKYVISMPELCDVTFLVGDSREPLHGVRAILASRSRHFYQLFLKEHNSIRYRKSETMVKGIFNKLRMRFKRKSLKVSKSNFNNGKLTIAVDDFEVDAFRRLLHFAHCGSVTVDAKSVIGLLNAAHTFGFEDLKRACWQFALSCIKPSTVNDLMTSSSKYLHFKTTKLLLQRVTEYKSNRVSPTGITSCRVRRGSPSTQNMDMDASAPNGPYIMIDNLQSIAEAREDIRTHPKPHDGNRSAWSNNSFFLRL